MHRLLFVLPLLLSAPLAAEDKIRTLAIGHWDCELPGEPGGATRREQAAASFEVATASRYVAADGTVGTYLLMGKDVTMTSGALSGTRFRRVRSGFLRRLDADGNPQPLRCVLSPAAESR